MSWLICATSFGEMEITGEVERQKGKEKAKK